MRILKSDKNIFWNQNNNQKPNFKSQEDWDSFLLDWFEETEDFKITQNLGRNISISNFVPLPQIEPNDKGYKFVELPLIIEAQGLFYYLEYPVADNVPGKLNGTYACDLWLSFWNKVDFSGLAFVERMTLPKEEDFYSKNIDISNYPMITKDVMELKIKLNDIGYDAETYAAVSDFINQKWVLFYTNKVESSSQETVIYSEEGRYFLPYTIIAVPMSSLNAYIEGDELPYDLAYINDFLMNNSGDDIGKVVVVNYLPFVDMLEDNGTVDTVKFSFGKIELKKNGTFYNFEISDDYKATGTKPFAMVMKSWRDLKINNNKIELVKNSFQEYQSYDIWNRDELNSSGNWVNDDSFWFDNNGKYPDAEVYTNAVLLNKPDSYYYWPTLYTKHKYFYSGNSRTETIDLSEFIKPDSTKLRLIFNFKLEASSSEEGVRIINLNVINGVVNHKRILIESLYVLDYLGGDSFGTAGPNGYRIDIINNIMTLNHKCNRFVKYNDFDAITIKNQYGNKLNINLTVYSSNEIPIETAYPFSFDNYFKADIPNYIRGLSRISIIKANMDPVILDITKLDNDFSNDIEVKSLIGDQLQGDEFFINNKNFRYEPYRANRLLFTYLNEAPLNFDAWKTYQATNRPNLIKSTFVNPLIGISTGVLGSIKNPLGIPLLIGSKALSSSLDTMAQRKTIKRSPDNISNSNADFFLNMFFGYTLSNYTLVLEQPIDRLMETMLREYNNYGVEIGNYVQVSRQDLNSEENHNYIKGEFINLFNGLPQEVINYFTQLFSVGLKLVHYNNGDFNVFG